MKIGLIVYSRTGNTLSVATRLRDVLREAGRVAEIERIEVMGDPTQTPGEVEFRALPDPSPYDMIVFGSPVQGFSLCPVMVRYLDQMAPIAGKRVALLVTEAFPYPWLGGNRAVRQMTRMCEEKGAAVCGSGIVNWMKKRREEQISRVVDRLSELACTIS